MSESGGSSESDSGSENENYEEAIVQAFLNVKTTNEDGITRKEIEAFIDSRTDISRTLSNGWQKQLKPMMDSFKSTQYVYFLRGRYRMDANLKQYIVAKGIGDGIEAFRKNHRRNLYHHQQHQQQQQQQKRHNNNNLRSKSKSRQKKSKKQFSIFLFFFVYYFFLSMFLVFLLFSFLFVVLFYCCNDIFCLVMCTVIQ